MTYGKSKNWYYTQMEENSNKWLETEDPEERKRLHDENVLLAEEMDRIYGTTTKYNDGGTWHSSDGTKSGLQGSKIVYKKDEDYNSYISPYTNDIKKAEDSIRNKKFNYDLENDPLWQAYKNQYSREADLSAADTLGEVAAMTGGMPSSYAASAATQAANYQKSKLTDKIPELYELAYNRYLADYNKDYQNLMYLMNVDNNAYNRWADKLDREYREQEADYDKLNYYNDFVYNVSHGDFLDKLAEKKLLLDERKIDLDERRTVVDEKNAELNAKKVATDEITTIFENQLKKQKYL